MMDTEHKKNIGIRRVEEQLAAARERCVQLEEVYHTLKRQKSAELEEGFVNVKRQQITDEKNDPKVLEEESS